MCVLVGLFRLVRLDHSLLSVSVLWFREYEGHNIKCVIMYQGMECFHCILEILMQEAVGSMFM